MKNGLRWDVFIATGVTVHERVLPPGEVRACWSPISATLIYGERDAVLVDPLLTQAQAETLATWVVQHRRRLTTIYATHGHGDHWFGAATVLQCFPEARFVATSGVIEVMRRQLTSPKWDAWNARFPDQLPRQITVAESLDGESIDLEGHALVPIDVGHTDTDATTVLHVPSLGLVIAGDVVYNGVHVFLGESDHGSREHWIASLDRVAALAPRTVVAGHKRPGAVDAPRTIAQTQAYIRDFDRLRASTSEPEELYWKVRECYPDRLNPDALWLSAQGARA